MKENDCLVIIPAYNEERNILHVLRGIDEYAQQVDIVVINDCSKDNTAMVVHKNRYRVINLCSNLGYSGAILTGFRYALIKDYEYVIQFDGDGQHDPREIKKLITSIKSSDSDIVIGSRFLAKKNYQHGVLRKLGTNIFSAVIKFLTGKRIKDPTSGLQILNKKAFSYCALSGNYPEYPDANILILLLKVGFKIKEVPVTMHERVNGVGMHDSFVKNIKYMIFMFYSIFICILKNIKYLR